MANEIQGILDTQNINVNEIIRDVDLRPIMLEPDKSKLIVLLEDLQSREVHNPKYEWQEDTYVSQELVLVGDQIATQTSLPVTDSAPCIVGDIIKVPRTKEMMKVTANNLGTNTLTVVRDVDNTGVTGVALVDGDEMKIIGNANEEGASIREIVTTQMDLPYNYIQIVRNPYGMTVTEANTDLYKGKDLAYQRKKMMTQHMKYLEKISLFSKRGLLTSGTHPERFTGGLEQIISTTVEDMGGTMTEIEWDTFLRQIFTYGSEKKLILCSSIYISAINYWAKSALRLNLGAKEYGMAIFDYVTPYGRAMLAQSEILTGAEYGGYAFGIDLDFVRKCHQQNLNTRKLTIAPVDGSETVREEYNTHFGIERKFEKAHGIAYNTTDYS